MPCMQGLSFAFPIPSQYTECCHDGEGIVFKLIYSQLHKHACVNFLYVYVFTFYPFHGEAELPLEFPDGTTPVTCRISIYDKSTDIKVGVGLLMNKASAPPLPAGSLYMEEVHVKVWSLPLPTLHCDNVNTFLMLQVLENYYYWCYCLEFFDFAPILMKNCSYTLVCLLRRL